METSRWKKLEAIYHSALAIEPSERDEFLQNICGGDAKMLNEAKKLLNANLPTAEFLKDDAFDFGMNILAQKVVKNRMKTIDDEGLIGERYELLKPLGEGGIGEVFLATDTKLNRNVVVKFLQKDKTSNWIIDKFKDEAVVQSQVSDPNVAVAFDRGVAADGQLYLVMEFIDGSNVSEIITRFQKDNEQIPFDLIVKIISQAGSGVEAIHHAKLVHRDLKPANLMWSKQGLLKVIDFGIARDLTKGTALFPVGTLPYMPIEQLNRQEVSPATDVFALGVIAYQLVTLRLPFMANDGLSHIRSRQESIKIPPCVLRSDLPKEAETLILQALSSETEKRPQSAKEFGDKLAEILTRKPEPIIITKPNYFKPLFAAASIAVLALAALAGWMWFVAGTKTVSAEEITVSRPASKPPETVPNAENKPPVSSQNPPNSSSETPVYDAESNFPTGEPTSGSVFAQIGLTFWRSRPATSQDDRNVVARETNDVKEEVVYESTGEFIKNGEKFRFSIEAMIGDYLIDKSTNKFLEQKGGYVYVINREQNADGTFGKARLIFPKSNLYNGENLFKSGQPIILPQKEGRVFEATRSSSKHIAETYTIIISPWKFSLPESLSENAMILPDSLFANWEREFSEKMYRGTLKNNGNKLMTIQEKLIMSRETNDVPESLTQSDTKTYPQTVYRGAVKIGNPSMFTVALKFKD